MRLPAEKSGKDFKSKIVKYLTEDNPAPLGAEEEKALARWEHADFLMRQHLERNDIILKLTHKFTISKFTADNDITNAQEVFSLSRRLNKAYIVHLNLQRIEKFIGFLEKKMYKDEDWRPDAKEIMAMAKLYEVHTYTANSIPQAPIKANLPPPIMNFFLVGQKPMDQPMTYEQAIEEADHFITDINEEPNEPDEPDTE